MLPLTIFLPSKQLKTAPPTGSQACAVTASILRCSSSPVLNKKCAKQLNQFAPAFGIGGKHYLDEAHRLQLYSELSGLPLGGRGHTYDLDIGVKYSPCKNLSANAGYRVLDLKIKNDDGTGLYKLSGWYGGLSYSF